MNGFEIFEPDDPFQFLHGRLEPFGRREIVACGKSVTRVEADADTTLVLD